MQIKEAYFFLDKLSKNDFLNLEQSLKRVGGVVDVFVSSSTLVIDVIYDISATTLEKIRERISSFLNNSTVIGIYEEELKTPSDDKFHFPYISLLRFIISILLFLVLYFSSSFDANIYSSFVVYIFMYLYCIYDVHKKAYEYMKKNDFLNIYFITSFSLLFVFVYKTFEIFFPEIFLKRFVLWHETGFFIVIISFGIYLFRYFSFRVNHVSDPRQIFPVFVKQYCNGKIENTYRDNVKSGDIVVMTTGDVIPFDGLIINGEAKIDEGFSYGDITLRNVEKGDSIRCGSMVISGEVLVEVQNDFNNTLIMKVIKIFQKKAKKSIDLFELLSKLVKRVLYLWFFFIVLCVLFFAVKYPLYKNLYIIFTLIILMCPYFLWISVPLTYIFLFLWSMKKGILIRNPIFFWNVSSCNSVVFFKSDDVNKDIVLKLKEKGFRTILVSKYKRDDEKIFDEVFYDVDVDEKHLVILRERFFGRKILSYCSTLSDIVCLSISDLGVLGGKNPFFSYIPSDVVFLREDISLLIYMIDYAKRFFKIIKESFYLSILIQLIFIILVLVAVSIDMFYVSKIMLIVVIYLLIILFNSLRIFFE